MTESDYWQALRKKLKNSVYAWKINASYAKGVPDWYGSGHNQDLWVENKRVASAQLPVSLDLTNVKKYLTYHQQEWLTNRYSEGRNVAVIVFSQHGHLLLKDLEWQKPISRLSYLDKAMTMKKLAEHIVDILGKKE
jgi:hypothetical protein